MSQIQSNTRVLEDDDASLISGGQATVLGEGEEFVDLNAVTTDNDDEPKKDDKPAAAAAAAATTAAQPAAATDDDLPPEYKGKTLKEIAQMHREAQQAIGRQGQELGELRRWADTLVRGGVARRPAPQAGQPAAQPAKIEESQVFAKPIETINQLVENHPIVQELRRTLGERAAVDAQRNMREAKARFDAAHPDAGEILGNVEFRQWVAASPKRRQMLLDANNKYDFDAGDEVFSTWKELNKARQPAATSQPAAAAAAPAAAEGTPTEAEVSAAAAVMARARTAKSASAQAAAAAAAAPTGGASPAGKGGGKKLYRRAEVINLMINDPDKYEQMEPEIKKAYAEGRVR